jgi:hypothetical protein
MQLLDLDLRLDMFIELLKDDRWLVDGGDHYETVDSLDRLLGLPCGIRLTQLTTDAARRILLTVDGDLDAAVLSANRALRPPASRP